MKKEKNEVPVWSKKNHSIFESFALELEEYPQSGQLPAHGDQDVSYALELQQKRLTSKNLTLCYTFLPRGHFADGGGMSKSWSDDHYISHMEYRTCHLTKAFFREDKRLFEKKENMIFYQIITTAHDRQTVDSDPYTCPNCGAISKISELQEGCPYCGTRFAMSDLFPKVTNYFFIKDSGRTESELKSELKRVMFPLMGIFAAFYSLFFFIGNDSGYPVWLKLLSSLLRGGFAGIICGGIIGYVFWAVKKLTTVFHEAGKSIPLLFNAAGSSKAFVSQMKQYSPDFSYEYFSGKVVSLLKMLLFSEDAAALPIYTGEPLGTQFLNLVESSPTGAVGLKQFRVQGDICYVVVDTYLDNIYEKAGRLISRRERFRVFLQRNIAKPVNLRFSIKSIQCKSCGGSFDATKQKFCPHCGTEYAIDDEDWTVTRLLSGF